MIFGDSHCRGHLSIICHATIPSSNTVPLYTEQLVLIAEVVPQDPIGGAEHLHPVSVQRTPHCMDPTFQYEAEKAKYSSSHHPITWQRSACL